MRIHLLDLHAGHVNRGTRALTELAAPWGEVRRYDVRSTGELPPVDGDVWVLTGGPGSPWEEGAWREPLLSALRVRVERGLPTLAVCYGFELLAIATGARVERLREERLGVWEWEWTDAGRADACLTLSGASGAFEQRSWGVWAVDGWAPAVLCRGAEGDVAAARWSPGVLGVIFHPEAAGAQVGELLGGALGVEVEARYGAQRLARMRELVVPGGERLVVGPWLAGLERGA